MQCEEFEARLNAVLDERQRPEWDADLCLHCETCSDCRQLAAAYEILLDGFYELSAPQVPSDMALRVVSEVRSQPRRPRRVVVGTAMLATAAGLLLAAVPLMRGTITSKSGPSAARAGRPAAVARHARPKGATALEQLPIVPELLSISTSADAAELAKETGQNLATVMLYVPGIGGGNGIIDADINFGGDESTWAHQMSQGLRPVSDSVAETLNLLLDSFPLMQIASRS